jgi:hypothetical protein
VRDILTCCLTSSYSSSGLDLHPDDDVRQEASSSFKGRLLDDGPALHLGWSLKQEGLGHVELEGGKDWTASRESVCFAIQQVLHK